MNSPISEVSNTIVIYADPETREVQVDVPIPKGGAIVPELRLGESKGILSFKNRTQEQLAHYVFWEHGTQDRIQEIIKRGKSAGVRQILKWLISMRIEEVYKKTQYVYTLKMVTDKSSWEVHLANKENAKSKNEK